MNPVAAGMAVTTLPQSATAMAPVNLVAVPFNDVRLSRTLGVVNRRGVPVSVPAKELLVQIRSCLIGHVGGREVTGPTPLAGPQG